MQGALSQKTLATNLGFPRFGYNRDLKKLVEAFWAGKIEKSDLLNGAKEIRKAHWYLQKVAGLGHIPSNDFSLYDHVLDHSILFGLVPDIYKQQLDDSLDVYFAMGRGLQNLDAGVDLQACEMKKWFNTNYHYIVPEVSPATVFNLGTTNENKVLKPVTEYLEALEMGIVTRPVLIGPISYLLLSKSTKDSPSDFRPLSLLSKLLPLYISILTQLANKGCTWVQIDEPFLVTDLSDNVLGCVADAYRQLSGVAGISLLLATYFESIPEKSLDVIVKTGIKALHVDLVYGKEQLDNVVSKLPENMVLSLGLVDGRNIWKTDLTKQLDFIQDTIAKLGKARVWIASSCSLIHSPHSLQFERKMNPEIKSWLSFAVEKIDEIVLLSLAVNHGRDFISGSLKENFDSLEKRRTSSLVNDPAVVKEMNKIDGSYLKRSAPFEVRSKAQQKVLNLPLFPTTSIGSFPQTKDVRVARQNYKTGKWTKEQYDQFMQEEIKRVIIFQEEVGLDVLVHGEPERNDMVEYFGEHLNGFVFSSNGWVQSYGSRCVKPPIIFGDVSRPTPITVDTLAYAQSLTNKKVKGMLTGPVTILQWSFVRDDQSRQQTTFQIALALRKEVCDLEAAGISLIQIDEPAIREGLPLKKSKQGEFLKWAVEAFLISSCGVRNETQIHTHMCYSDFNDIFQSIKDLDADCITIENSKSDLKLLDAFDEYGYQNYIGPGLYDIHSARVPGHKEMKDRLTAICKGLKPELVWINPDCGLKTRGWEETKSSLSEMVSVAKECREEFLIR